MLEEKIRQLSTEFRCAIEEAQKQGEFEKDFLFSRFPRGCCGDTCILLGQFLLMNGIDSWYVCGNYYGANGSFQSHAWLNVGDELIVDITGDQFRNKTIFLKYNIPVYIGQVDSFHKLFVVERRNVRKSAPLSSWDCIDPNRLPDLYQRICKYI